MTPEEVRTRLERTAPHLLEVDVAELSLDGLDDITAHRIWNHSRRRSGGLTVGRALRELPARDRDALARWLFDRRELGVALRPGMRVEELEDWATQHGMAWALELRMTNAPTNDFVARYFEGTLADAVRVGSPHRWASGTQLARTAIECLEALRVDAEAVRDAEPALLAALAVGASGPLGDVYRRVRSRYDVVRANHAPALEVDDHVVVHLDPPAVEVGVLGTRIQVLLDGDLPCLPDFPECELALLMGVMTFTATDGEPQRKLARALSLPRWARDLDHVSALLADVEPLDEERPHLVWEVATGQALELAPSMCRVTRSGGYLGKRIESSDLVGRAGLSDVDSRIVSALHRWNRPPREVVLEALEALAGHPRVVYRGQGAKSPVAVRTGSLELALDRDDDGIHARFLAAGRALERDEILDAVRGDDVAGGRLAIARPDELLVVRCTEDQRRLVWSWLARDPELPHEALPQLLELMPALQARLPVSLGAGLRGRKIGGDERPVLRLRMEAASLVVEPWVRPLPDAPGYPPGDGPATLHVVRDGLPCFHARDLGEEPGRVRTVLRELGVPDGARQGGWLWAVDDADAALDVVRALDAERHRVEVDETLPRLVDATSSELQLVVRSSGIGWFEVDGELKTALGKVSLSDVLAAAREGRRYVRVGKSRFVRLEEALLARASALDAAGAGEGLGAVHAPLIEALEHDGALVDGPAAWKETVSRLRSAHDLAVELPDGLQAELREYQREGFTWLARQAEWAPGAVLADDMGLGKTVQSIALLLRRRDLGAALVVAPTSVVFNWQRELERFAPSLRVLVYTGAGRAGILDEAGAADVVLTTYGIALRDAEALAARDWATLVLDEAQALKNPESQRSRAMCTLGAGFKVALSGTPVENHEVELWSLFAVLVPGLFGSLARFRQRFLVSGGRSALAAMVGPFVLRRTKKQVAPELPDRTEVVQTLELSDDHRAFYATEVAAALERIADAPPKRRRFTIGQQLMRLRQAASDPRLVDPGSPFVGPKVRWLVRSLRGVLESGEQALVFSSYVTLLELVRAELQREGVGVAWLTGSTAAPARATEVGRFQDGEVGVFLISLKAGGVGLNLTAASYVFILDPWWNPAAEDQAADRAHRIGQDKAVTIYKGVAAGTVEEKILEMQQGKRELVDALMAGAGSAEVMSASELMLLLAPPAVPAPAAPAPLRLVAARSVDDEIERALVALAAAPLKDSSRLVYERSLRAFAAWAAEQSSAGLIVLRDRYRAACEAGDLPASRWRSLAPAWKAGGLPPSE